MTSELEGQVRRVMREAAATYSLLIGVPGLPAELTRRVLAGRLLRATTVANLLADAVTETKLRGEIEVFAGRAKTALEERMPQDDNLP